MKTSSHWLTATLLILLLTPIVWGFWYYHVYELAQQQQELERLGALATMTAQAAALWRAERLADATSLAASPALRMVDESSANAAALLLDQSGQAPFEALLLVDLEGRVRLASPGASERLAPEERNALATALRERAPQLADLPPGAERPGLSLSVVTLIVDEAGAQPLAALILRADAEAQLEPLLGQGSAVAIKLDAAADRASAGTSAPLSATIAVPGSGWQIVATALAERPAAEDEGYAAAFLFSSIALGWFALTGLALAFMRERDAHEQALLSSLAQLRASEERYRTTLMSIGDGLIATDAEGRVDLLDPVAEQLTGWPQHEAQGRPIEEVFRIINETSRTPVEIPARKAIREGAVVAMDNHTLLIARDGSERPITDSGAPIRSPEGQITGAVLVFRDQSTERAAQEALRQSEARLSSILSTMEEVIWSVRLPDYTPIFITPSVERLYGITHEQFKADGSLWEQVIYPDDRGVIARIYAQLMDEGEYAEEYRIVAVNGTLKWVRNRGRLICDAAGAPLRVDGIVTDITPRREALAALEATKELLSQASRIASIGGWEIDVPSGRLFWSEVTYAIHEVDQSFEPDIDTAISYYKPGPSREAIRCALQACIKQGKPFDLELEFVSAGGRELWVRSVGQPTFEGERCVKVWGVFQDITRQRQLQEQLLTTQKLEAVGRLASGVAHDYNNALQAILGNAELALVSEVNGPLSRYLEEIRAAAQRSATITRQLLGFARSQRSQPRPLDVNVVIEQLIAMLRRLIREDITLSWQPGRALWPVLLDPSQLDQIVTNLLLNARDAVSASGTITVTTANVVARTKESGGPPPGEFVLLTVRDNGIGMDAATQAQLFEPFFTTKPIGQGTGLGMPSVANIVRQLSGVIMVSSAPGAGTVVRVYLPRAAEDVPMSAEARPPLAVAAIAGATVLLCEDDGAVRDLGQRILARLGYSVLIAATPGAALSLAARHPGPIDLLITDVVMPELSGPELVRQILPLRPTLRWLFMSGHAAETLTLEGGLLDAVHFIQKPFSMAELSARVRAVLET
jgi:two-component system, cell cycle sensor histidine kinase and response regulator CckA